MSVSRQEAFNVHTHHTGAKVTDRVQPMDPMRAHLDSLDLAGKVLEWSLVKDSSFPSLVEVMQIVPHGYPTASGLNDLDYPSLADLSGGLVTTLKEVTTVNKVPLPPEIMEHFGHMQCNCTMGLFTEISRAWLTIDSDIYIWNYEFGTDVSYFDGLGETIVSVGLVKPKEGVFQKYVKYLLVLTTSIEIVVLGVTFSAKKGVGETEIEEMNLLPDPVFVVPTDGVIINTVASTESGRIFMGAQDGSLVEVSYQAQVGWFGKRWRKVNHSVGALSFLVPSFLNVAFSDEDAIVQITVDNSRHALYCLTEHGTIEVWDLGATGTSTSKVTSITQTQLVQQAVNIVKTLEANNFRPLVSISALEVSESPHLNLVAVVQTGARLYLSTGSSSSPSARPYSLTLLHVRLPPGFAANAPAHRPSTVHMARYKKGVVTLVTSPGGDHDVLWCLSRDAHPFQSLLVESPSLVALDGAAWAVEEVHMQPRLQCTRPEIVAEASVVPPVPVTPGAAPTQPQVAVMDPPVVVTQHMEPPRKLVVLTAQGSHILSKLRPVDLLRQLLTAAGGPESDAVRAYFTWQHEEQACATSLVLACLEPGQVAEWASRAFFLYGGEPKDIPAAYDFLPPSASTPLASAPLPSTPLALTPFGQGATTLSSAPSVRVGDGVRHATVKHSAKHDGLYLYVGRILRPVWNLRVVRGTELVSSTVSWEDLAWLLGLLHALRSFLEKNTQFAATNISTATTKPLQDAHLQEKRSLDALSRLVTHTCEVLGLWKVLCEHQLHVIVAALSQEHQNQLLKMTFRSLILVGYEQCSLLTNSLINMYLKDNASVDSISTKLQQVCPNLYKMEDAACSKANEMLLAARKTQNKEEREEKLNAALQLCKSVAPRVNLPLLCRWFAACHYYEGALDLALVCAAKLDDRGLALHYYRNGEPAEDSEGFAAFSRRMDCYKEVTGLLEMLYGQAQSSPYTPSIPAAPGAPPAPDTTQLTPAEADKEAKRLLTLALRSQDELCHMAVYSWLLARGLTGDLLAVAQPSLELFLTRAVTRTPDVADLLWKFHEKRKEHEAAARVLYQLASRPGSQPPLTERVACLARAVMCLRSSEAGCAPHLGVFLRELEDRLEVARLQQKVLEGVTNLRTRHPLAEGAIMKLNSGLLDITELYEDYAEVFGLWEAKLAIIHCSGHLDTTLVETVWEHILVDELYTHQGLAGPGHVAVLCGKVESLGREYVRSPRCFPVFYLVRTLEVYSCQLDGPPASVYRVMLNLGVSIVKLLDVYDRLIAAWDRVWLAEGDEFHLVRVIAELLGEFAASPNKMALPSERRMAIQKAGDVLSNCLTALYRKPDTAELVTLLRGIQFRLQRLGNAG